MKRTLKITLFSLILLFVGSIALSTPATSQAIPLQQLTDTPTATATTTPTATATATTPTGIVITAVQPGTVSNEVATELVVTGSGFANGAVVILANFGALDTTFVSSNLLRATVPASTPAGTYSLSVVNPDASSASLANAVTITGPAGPTSTPVPSSTPGPTAYIRPLLVVQSYGASSEIIAPGENYDFEMTFTNAGQLAATNVIATFTTGDFIPRVTGGVQALGTIGAGGNHRFWQPLAATRDIAGKTVAILEVKVSYTDANGTAYSDTFALTFPVVRQGGGVAPTSTPTPTATPTATATPTVGPLLRPQLLITSYNTDLSQLEPGKTFALQLSVQNAGNADAENITMILGGGSSSDSSTGGTPGPGGGLSGAGGEFSNFAPVNSSNVSSLGNLAVGQSLQASQTLIVNASTKAGAYPVKVSFVYNDDNNSSFVDDQVITLLVYQQPLVDLNFYTQPAPLFVGQPGSLPLQVVNTGKNSAVFGNFTVTAPSAQLSNNTIFVGALEPGGFFPLDAQIIPEQPGMLDLLVSIGYTNDFNQQKFITTTLSIEVIDAPIIEPPIDGGEVPPDGGFPPVDGGGVSGGESTQETFAQKLWRFFLGLIGLDSGISEPEFPTGGYGVPYGSPYGQPYGVPYGAP